MRCLRIKKGISQGTGHGDETDTTFCFGFFLLFFKDFNCQDKRLRREKTTVPKDPGQRTLSLWATRGDPPPCLPHREKLPEASGRGAGGARSETAGAQVRIPGNPCPSWCLNSLCPAAATGRGLLPPPTRCLPGSENKHSVSACSRKVFEWGADCSEAGL